MDQPVRAHPCAGGLVFDERRRLLLIRRAQPPAVGCWSVPGGHCNPAEPPELACVREVAEETGLTVSVSRWAGRVVRDRPSGGVYEIDDYVCTVLSGVLRAGDDASDARWVSRAELAQLPLAPLLWETLAEWELLPE